MRGYKGMASDMTCRGMQYEVGKSYHVDGDIKLCENGLHFCQQLTDVFNYYPTSLDWFVFYPNINRYFEIEATGNVVTNGDKSAASDLTILRELTLTEIIRCIYDDYSHGDFFSHNFGDGYYGDGLGNGCGNDVNGDRDGCGYGNGDGAYNYYGDGCGRGYDNISRILAYQE